MTWLRKYGYSDCIFCDIVAHQPWEPARFEYEDDDVAVFHNVLGWIPVMLLAVPRGRVIADPEGQDRHYEQQDLWRNMGRLGEVAVRMGRMHCMFDGAARFRLVSNFGSLALQTQSHAHMHVLGAPFAPSFPDLRADGELVYEDGALHAYLGKLDPRSHRSPAVALMIVPREPLSQDEFFTRMSDFGTKILELAARYVGESYRILAEVGPHAPVEDNGAHLFVLGGTPLGHYV
jgi:diadenosine tetraphosphate (Ap4A) HIT family hydrolase